jgi:hypothetical protein
MAISGTLNTAWMIRLGKRRDNLEKQLSAILPKKEVLLVTG